MKIKLSKKWLASPYVIWMIGFIILPLITIFIYGFTVSKTDSSFTLDNIINAAKDEVNLKAMGLSLLISLISTVICFLLAYPLAMCLN
ncbi:MAG: ABC transporter permease, partial [Ruminococcus sp.]|nr:ABC transporter permease [Ruminococcus sp.]